MELGILNLLSGMVMALVALVTLKGEVRRDALLFAIAVKLSGIGWILYYIGKELIE